MTRSLIIVAAATVISTAGWASSGPGELREELAYGKTSGFSAIGCPEGTHLVMRGAEVGSGVGLEEACYSPDGVRTGYYLRWHQDGSHWAEFGQYRQGRREGRWLRFDQKGEKVAVAYYRRGRLARQQSFE